MNAPRAEDAAAALATLRVADLKRVCRFVRCGVSGSKAELVDRLVAALHGQPDLAERTGACGSGGGGREKRTD